MLGEGTSMRQILNPKYYLKGNHVEEKPFLSMLGQVKENSLQNIAVTLGNGNEVSFGEWK